MKLTLLREPGKRGFMQPPNHKVNYNPHNFGQLIRKEIINRNFRAG
jgi:hypothetical protein